MIKIKHALLIAIFSFGFCPLLKAQKTIVQYLSGTDKDHTVNWEFMCTKGRNSGNWTTIPVPSNWEMQGFGSYSYYNDVKDPEQGFYKYKFKVPAAYKDKKVIIVFNASMTDTEVKINGLSAGDVHQGGFYEFKYDISDLIKFNTENLLEVTVSRHSTNASINKAERHADFWMFGGIFRPVYLEIVPITHIERVAIDAKASGDFNVTVFANKTNDKQKIEAQIETLTGTIVGKPFTLPASDSLVLSQHADQIKTWNPEQPNLYNAIISIKENGKTVHTIKQRFGFRTTELRLNDGFYVNGAKVIFKGVNRHSEWPESGRTLSRDIHLMDIGLIKEMNMNAVRMCHYPPDKEFLDLCDSLGLFVLDELTGWQAFYDTIVGRKLVKELVVRDVNHPSIVIWDNGNEGGFNRALDNEYQLYDPQKRWVIHPWERFNGTNTKHYPDFKYLLKEAATGKEVFFPTEFMHGLFDGGHGAALEDFWGEMMKNRLAAGGFLWSFHDEGVVRADKNNAIDVDGNHAPDGIVGPHREKEGSFFAIKETWSPIQITTKTLPENFNGKLPIENHYIYTNLNKCSFDWKLVKFPVAGGTASTLAKGLAQPLNLAPNEKGTLTINMPTQAGADALYVTAYDFNNKEVFTWSWAIHSPQQMAVVVSKAAVPTTLKDDSDLLIVSSNGVAYNFDKKTGFLTKVVSGQTAISLTEGPALAGVSLTLVGFKNHEDGEAYIVEPIYADSNHFTIKWTFRKGQFPQLDYQYFIDKESNYRGITFNYPEEKINGAEWLGRGPYHVWKNRLQGQQLGVWQKKYNNTITGESWEYPEFKGWHSELYWFTLQNKESNFTVYAKTNGIYLQLLKPQKPLAAPNNNINPPFPGNTIGFFDAISPIGTKFQDPKLMGPQSQKNEAMKQPFTGTLLFDF
ncbi:glycoside hydrolase family 2 TIM barrel-domain containing protein [Parasediminibacterium sp. JCM 36343]|uniref:glycoside hydrolase family 2 protein n=1 Tax=Parasediminibacterium sp. JCM 36343 TaxID=3374279 RepID=UPI00397D8139